MHHPAVVFIVTAKKSESGADSNVSNDYLILPDPSGATIHGSRNTRAAQPDIPKLWKCRLPQQKTDRKEKSASNRLLLLRKKKIPLVSRYIALSKSGKRSKGGWGSSITAGIDSQALLTDSVSGLLRHRDRRTERWAHPYDVTQGRRSENCGKFPRPLYS